jgi:SAM-dependent methyltransferase
MEIRDNHEVLAELLDLGGKRILDVGCGGGGLVRMMTRRGARVWGLDPTAGQMEKALAAEAAGDEAYVEGAAEDMPFGPGVMDIVVFFNSLHHVEDPVKALAEAARVLKADGLAYIAEPLAEGSHYQMGRAVDDEVEVRRRAYQAIGAAAAFDLGEKCEVTYIHLSRHQSFEAYRDNTTRINPGRRAVFEAGEAALRANFVKHGRRTDAGWEFDQPIRVNLLVKG